MPCQLCEFGGFVRSKKKVKKTLTENVLFGSKAFFKIDSDD